MNKNTMNWLSTPTRGNPANLRPKEDTRTPLYMLYGIDCSGSMSEQTCIVGETGAKMSVSKIEQANQGMKKSVQSIIRFQRENTRFSVKWQVVELNTYCKSIFPTYVNVDDHSLSEVVFRASGSTHIEALFNTFANFITQKHLGHYNRAVNVILMSDGIPTNIDGYALPMAQWQEIVDKFKSYLDKNDFSRNVDLYFIAVGDEAEPFGRYFAGDDHFFKVEEAESLTDKIDFVTRQSLADSSSIPTNAVGYDDYVDPNSYMNGNAAQATPNSSSDDDDDDDDIQNDPIFVYGKDPDFDINGYLRAIDSQEEDEDEDEEEVEDEEDDPELEDEEIDEEEEETEEEENEENEDGEENDDDIPVDDVFKY